MMNGEPFFFVVENFSSQKMICNQEQGVLFISIHLMSCLWRDIFASAGKKWINERRTKRKGSKTTPVYALRRRHAQNKFYDVQHQKTSSIQRYNAQAITGKEHLIRFKSISINSFSFALRRDRKKIPYRLCFAVKSKKKIDTIFYRNTMLMYVSSISIVCKVVDEYRIPNAENFNSVRKNYEMIEKSWRRHSASLCSAQACESTINFSSAMWLVKRINKVIEIGSVNASNTTKWCVTNNVFAAMALAHWICWLPLFVRSLVRCNCILNCIFIDMLLMLVPFRIQIHFSLQPNEHQIQIQMTV